MDAPRVSKGLRPVLRGMLVFGIVAGTLTWALLQGPGASRFAMEGLMGTPLRNGVMAFMVGFLPGTLMGAMMTGAASFALLITGRTPTLLSWLIPGLGTTKIDLVNQADMAAECEQHRKAKEDAEVRLDVFLDEMDDLVRLRDEALKEAAIASLIAAGFAVLLALFWWVLVIGEMLALATLAAAIAAGVLLAKVTTLNGLITNLRKKIKKTRDEIKEHKKFLDKNCNVKATPLKVDIKIPLGKAAIKT